MTPEKDAAQFGRILSALYALYHPRLPLSDEVRHIWWILLSPYPFEEVHQACVAFMRHTDMGHFAPQPADVIKLIEGSTESRALQAWQQVVMAVRRHGPYRSIRFEDPWIHAASQSLGGWVAVCGVPESEWPFTKNAFLTQYKAYTVAPPQDIPPVLLGLTQQDCQRLGRPVTEPPCLVAKPPRAAIVARASDFLEAPASPVASDEDIDANYQRGALSHAR